MPHRIYVGTKPVYRDARGENLRKRITHDLGITSIEAIRTATVYTLNGQFSPAELQQLARGPLSDPVVQSFTIDQTFSHAFGWMVEVGFLPGVTDNAGRTAREACAIMLKRDLGADFSVHTATQYFFDGTLSREQVNTIAESLLANKLIQSIARYTLEEWLAVHTNDFPAPRVSATGVKPTLYREIDLNVSDAELMRISKEGVLVLSLEEMKVIQAHYATASVRAARTAQGMPENPTNVELEVLAQTWSEHCKHKIFNAIIDYEDEKGNKRTITSLFKEFVYRTTDDVRKAKGDKDICLSVFKDNAGVIRFTDSHALVFKVETHNSPSALDPYGGALTGIVGVNRDTVGTGLGCRMIANTDVFCFAPPSYDKPVPPRILHPRRVFEGVREGVEHGGNKSGIPTVNGSIVFDERFLGKPLVYCGTLGLMEMEINGRKGYEKQVDKGDHILMVGGRIGKDGIHGATFSSEPLHEGSPATAVQIGDPITQKRMTDFLEYARKHNLYSSQTDNGAGGLSSSIGEMAEDTGGARVHLERAPLKYPGLEPWEIFVSEAQERMTIAVPPQKVARFLELAAEWNVEATDLGEFTDSGVLEICYDDTTVARLDMEFLHRGLPRMQLRARWIPTAENAGPLGESTTLDKDILALLARPNICSKEYVVRQYDHEVQAGSVVKPLCGVANDGPSDAGVIRPILDADVGVVVSHGIVPRYSDIDTYAMAAAAVDEAVRNAVASGADPDHMAALDNFCWCDPVQSPDNPDGEYKLAQLVRAGQALYDVCVAYNMPLISGKDSMKNDYRIGSTRISIPPALLVSLIARIPNVNQAVTMDFKAAGNAIYLLGITKPELGASEYALHKGLSGLRVPRIDDPAALFASYRALHGAIRAGLVRAAHDLSDGGLAIALVEMCFAGALGASVDLSKVTAPGCSSATEVLFSESQGRILLEVAPDKQAAFEAALAGHACERIGVVQAGEMVAIAGLGGQPLVSLSHVDGKAAWKNALDFQ